MFIIHQNNTLGRQYTSGKLLEEVVGNLLQTLRRSGFHGIYRLITMTFEGSFNLRKQKEARRCQIGTVYWLGQRAWPDSR